MHKLKQFWQWFEKNEKMSKFLERIIIIYFILLGLFALYIITGSFLVVYAWGEEEQQQINKCVAEGHEYGECRDLYNW